MSRRNVRFLGGQLFLDIAATTVHFITPRRSAPGGYILAIVQISTSIAGNVTVTLRWHA